MESVPAHVGQPRRCVAGALEEHTYRRLLAEAGFLDAQVEVTRVHEPTPGWAPDQGRLVSAFVRATRPR